MTTQTTNLLDRPVYGVGQVDAILALTAGTATRWVDGYSRGGKDFPPIIRPEPTGSELVTWGEFAEARLLAEYRGAGVPIQRLRPAVDALRDESNLRYPLAYYSQFLEAEGKELLRRVQDEVGLEAGLRFVVVRNNQIALALPVDRFVASADWGEEQGVVERIRPNANTPDVWLDPVRQFGEPTVRSVPTAVLGEQFRAGDSVAMLARIYELPEGWIEQAIRYEFMRRSAGQAA